MTTQRAGLYGKLNKNLFFLISRVLSRFLFLNLCFQMVSLVNAIFYLLKCACVQIFSKFTIKSSQAYHTATATATIADRNRQAHPVPAEFSSLPAKMDAGRLDLVDYFCWSLGYYYFILWLHVKCPLINICIMVKTFLRFRGQ